MTEDILVQARKLVSEATPGPWEWFGNTRYNTCHLATIHGGRRFVLDFDRWGMRSAQPRFQVTLEGKVGTGYMVKLSEMPTMCPDLGPVYEVSHRQDFIGINHPDARLIAAAPTVVSKLCDEVEQLRKELKKVCKALDDLTFGRTERVKG